MPFIVFGTPCSIGLGDMSRRAFRPIFHLTPKEHVGFGFEPKKRPGSTSVHHHEEDQQDRDRGHGHIRAVEDVTVQIRGEIGSIPVQELIEIGGHHVFGRLKPEAHLPRLDAKGLIGFDDGSDDGFQILDPDVIVPFGRRQTLAFRRKKGNRGEYVRPLGRIGGQVHLIHRDALLIETGGRCRRKLALQPVVVNPCRSGPVRDQKQKHHDGCQSEP
jgi:hypothetical protein